MPSGATTIAVGLLIAGASATSSIRQPGASLRDVELPQPVRAAARHPPRRRATAIVRRLVNMGREGTATSAKSPRDTPQAGDRDCRGGILADVPLGHKATRAVGADIRARDDAASWKRWTGHNSSYLQVVVFSQRTWTSTGNLPLNLRSTAAPVLINADHAICFRIKVLRKAGVRIVSGPDKLRSAETCAGKVRPLDVGVTADVIRPEIRFIEVRAGEVCMFQVGTPKIGAAQFCASERGPERRDPVEVGFAEVSSVEFGSVAVSTLQDRADEASRREIGVGKVGACED